MAQILSHHPIHSLLKMFHQHIPALIIKYSQSETQPKSGLVMVNLKI